MTLLAFAAERRAAAQLLVDAPRLLRCPLARRSAANQPHAATYGRMMEL